MRRFDLFTLSDFTLITAAFVGSLLLVGTRDVEAQLFEDVTTTAGVDYIQASNTGAVAAGVMTGGAAAGDFDGDGWVDLFVTRLQAPDILFRNLGGTFQDVSATAFALPPPDGANNDSNGAAFADVDNDGDLDLYVVKPAGPRNYLYINNGDGTFAEDAQARGAAIEVPGGFTRTSVAFGDYDLDGNLDAYTGEWRGPSSDPTRARLLHNTGAGNFEDTTELAGVNMARPDGSVRVFSPRFTDLNNDSHPDLAVAADFGQSQLFWNQGDGTFEDGTVAPLGADQNGMGANIGDLNGDGHLDWWVTSIYNGDDKIGNRLYQNNGDGDVNNPPTFSDVTDAVGVADGGWGWGTEIFDYDNDGDNDIVMTNGWRNANAGAGDFTSDQTRLFRNDRGTFAEVATAEGITDTDQGRGLLTFDFDNDGDLDVFVANNGNDGPVLYQNNASGNDWLQIITEGTVSNRNGIGAVVTVIPDEQAYNPLDPQPGTIFVHEMDGGSNFLSQSEMLAHFGLGDLADGESVDKVQIRWPSGEIQEFTDVAPNTRYVAHEYGDLISVSTAAVPEFSGFAIWTLIAASCLGINRWRATR